MSKSRVMAMKALRVPAVSKPPLGLSPEEGVEIIRARRRGVTLVQLGKALGYKPGSGNILSALGTWACRYAKIPGDKNER